jgi:hypothetical protein
VAGASRENERFDVDHASADTRRQRLAGDADDRGVHLAAGDRFQQLVVVPLADDDLDRWVRAVKVAEHPEDPPFDRRSHDPDHQCPSQQSRQRGDCVPPALDGRDGGAGMRQQRLARLGQARGAPVAMKRTSPSSASRRRIWWLMAGWATDTRTAARVNCCSSATATK